MGLSSTSQIAVRVLVLAVVVSCTPSSEPAGVQPAALTTSELTAESAVSSEVLYSDEAATVDGSIVVTGPPGPETGQVAAELGGVLVLQEGCVFLELGAGELALVVWEFGTVWDSAEQSVRSPGGSLLPIGSEILGGGASSNKWVRGTLFGSEVDSFMSSCAGVGRLDWVGLHSVNLVSEP